MREISTKKIEIGEHVLLDGVEHVAEKGDCNACEYVDICDYATFCPVGGKLTKVGKQPTKEEVKVEKHHTDEQDKDTTMTNLQLAEWLAKGHGQAQFYDTAAIFSVLTFREDEENEAVNEDLLIRPWGTDEWVKPTVAIYKRDCR